MLIYGSEREFTVPSLIIDDLISRNPIKPRGECVIPGSALFDRLVHLQKHLASQVFGQLLVPDSRKDVSVDVRKAKLKKLFTSFRVAFQSSVKQCLFDLFLQFGLGGEKGAVEPGVLYFQSRGNPGLIQGKWPSV